MFVQYLFMFLLLSQSKKVSAKFIIKNLMFERMINLVASLVSILNASFNLH